MNRGGDMVVGVTRAHLETPAEIDAIPTDIAVDVPTATALTAGKGYKSQHAKVLRFEISVGKRDDETILEEFERYVRSALSAASQDDGDPLEFDHLTLLGGYYIIDGHVCLADDYDPLTRNRKPGTYPPSWAGGPKSGERPAAVVRDEPEEPASAPRTRPKGDATSVTALGASITAQVRAGKHDR